MNLEHIVTRPFRNPKRTSLLWRLRICTNKTAVESFMWHSSYSNRSDILNTGSQSKPSLSKEFGQKLRTDFQGWKLCPKTGGDGWLSFNLDHACLSKRISLSSHKTCHFSTLASAARKCWNCGEYLRIVDGSTAGSYFCQACSKVLPVEGDLTYFQVMQSNEDFKVKIDRLTRHFRKLQAMLHPDKFAQASLTEQKYSTEQSSLVNKAYQTLQDPLSRAVYMLELHGVFIEESNTSTEPDFLLEMFENNELLAECSSVTKLNHLGKLNEDRIAGAISNLTVAFDKGDYQLAKELVIKLKYYYNIRETIKEKRLALS